MSSIEHCANSGLAVWPIRCTFARSKREQIHLGHSIFSAFWFTTSSIAAEIGLLSGDSARRLP